MCFFRDPREGGRKQCVFEAFQNARCLQLELQLEGGRKQCVFEAFQNALCLQLELQLEGGRKQCVFEAFQNALCLQLELQLEGGRKQCVFEAFQNALCLQLELQLEGGRKQCVFEAFQNALCLQLDGGKGERKRAGLPKRTLLATGGRGGGREQCVFQVFQNALRLHGLVSQNYMLIGALVRLGWWPKRTELFFSAIRTVHPSWSRPSPGGVSTCFTGCKALSESGSILDLGNPKP